MLVCSVSVRARRTVAAIIAEAGAAADAVSTPGLGQLVQETASAADTVSVQYNGMADIVETVSAADTAGATVQVATTVPATFDGTPSSVAVTGSGLIATHTDSSSFAGVRSTFNKTAGKFYFEVTVGQHSSSASDCAGILLSTGTYINLLNADNCTTVVLSSGNIFTLSGFSGRSTGAVVTGNIVGVAIDLDNRKAWFRKDGGNWNGLAIGSENPATNTGGVTITTGSFAPAVGFNWAPSDSMTANFGQSSFAAAAPSGFSNWAQ